MNHQRPRIIDCGLDKPGASPEGKSVSREDQRDNAVHRVPEDLQGEVRVDVSDRGRVLLPTASVASRLLRPGVAGRAG
jgi:hypothetical protein